MCYSSFKTIALVVMWLAISNWANKIQLKIQVAWMHLYGAHLYMYVYMSMFCDP